MNWKIRLALAVVAAAMLAPLATQAEDIDIFLTSVTATNTKPNVLIVLDNASSNNSTITQLNGTSGDKLEMLRQVMNVLVDPLNSTYFPSCVVTPATTVNGVETPEKRVPDGCKTRQEIYDLIKNVNLGLMIQNPSGATKGAYVRYHVRDMGDSANRTSFLTKVNPSIPQSNNAPYAKSMHEAYQYFGGKPAYAGFDTKSPYDTAARSGSNYVSPATDSCQGNFIIFVGNGGPDSGEDSDAKTLLNGIGGVVTGDPIKFTPSNFQSNWFDEYARTLKKQDVAPIDGVQNITTYTIAVQNPADNNYKTSPMVSARMLLQVGAVQGGGEYYLANDAQATLRAFTDSLSKMQPVNSVFAAVTLPVSVNVRGSYLNQVYMGQFRPDANAAPRWPGNLKLYQIGLNSIGNPVLADRKGIAAEDTVNGFLRSTSTSFWTVDSTYWTFDKKMAASDAPDGRIVEKGGAAQRLRATYTSSQTDRKIYTCNGSCGSTGTLLSTTLFDNTNTTGITVANLGVLDDAERTALINWVRGEDNKNDENLDGVATDIRARPHGDLLHSRPSVVNYNRSVGDRDIMVYYGANDGFVHAVKGGADDTDGIEKWSLVLPEFFGKFKRLRDNTTPISTVNPKPYFADGAVSVYQKDANSDGKLIASDGDKVYIYIGMRRGGRFAYALDVSDPDAPKFLWKIDNATTGFSELGQTWSLMRPAIIRAVATDPVVIFGAGYDPTHEDAEPATTNTMGRGIFIVNGRTGALVKQLLPTGMGAVPADLTVIDRDGDGLFDRIYAVDTKGNVWRFDIDDANPDNWTSFKIASLGGTGANARKFLNKPDVVPGTDFDAVLIGSGDREHPFETTITNRFYMLKDTFTGKSGGLFCGGATCAESDLTDVTSNPYQTGTLPSESKGWYITLGTGEKVVGNPITVGGAVFFGTNLPTPVAPGVCSANLGEARLYVVGFKTGNAAMDLNADGSVGTSDRYEKIAGGGFLPSPVYARVSIDGKEKSVICVGAHCLPPPNSGVTGSRGRTYWYTKQ